MSYKINKYKEKSKKNFDAKADNYFNTWDGKYSKLMYAGVLEKINLKPFASILDVGCGTGAILSVVVTQNIHVAASGIDISEKMIEKATEIMAGKAELIIGDADDLPWNDSSFDLVICNSSFHHYPEPLKVLIEIRRILKSNGRIIIADPWWSDLKRSLINWYLNTPLNLEGDVRIYSEQEFRKMLLESGFTSIEYEKPTNKYCVVVAVARK